MIKDNEDKKEYPDYQPGDKVYFYVNHGAGRIDKLLMIWNGLAIIISKLGYDAYLIKDQNGHLINHIHVSHLKYTFQ